MGGWIWAHVSGRGGVGWWMIEWMQKRTHIVKGRLVCGKMQCRHYAQLSIRS